MSEEAANVVQHLAQQTQLLASLHWLSSLQVLASIPLTQTVAAKDVAELTGVPCHELLRLIRTAATAGFLQEPQPGMVRHTPLSAQLVKRPFLSDAVAFLSNTALPSSLQMVTATGIRAPPSHHHLAVQEAKEPSLNLVARCERNPKLKRQVAAYHRLRQNAFDESVSEIMSRLDWTNLGDANVVQVGSQTTATARALIAQHPGLRFVVQMVDRDGLEATRPLDPRISIQVRARGDLQLIKTAQVYVLYLPGGCLYSSREVALAGITAELRIHFDVLRGNRNARLLLVAELLPEPGTADGNIEGAARSHDLLLMQLADGGLLNLAELQDILSSVGDETGTLLVVNQLSSRHSPTVVLQVRIEGA